MLWAQIATPLFYAAVALGVCWLVSRTLLPVSRRAALLLVLLPLCFTGRALLTGKVYGPINLAYAGEPFAGRGAELGVAPAYAAILHDLYAAVIPWHSAVRYAWSQGEWPLLNPFMLCGDVLAASAQPAPFYPPNLLSLPLPLPLALGFLAALHFFLAALGLFLYARSVGCREEAAFLGAAAWAFSGAVAFWIGWPLGMTTIFLPWVILAVRRLAREPGPGSGLLLTVVLALGILAGHPETVAHLVGLGAFYGLGELLSRPRAAWPRILGWTLAAGAAALGATAIFWLPFVDALLQTYQWHLRQGVTAHLKGVESLADLVYRLVPNLVPFVHGFGRFHATGAPKHFLPLATAFAGAVVLPLALYALARSPWRGRWGIAALALLGIAAGAKTPGLFELLGALPPFHIALNDRLIAAGGFGLAVLAALGLEAWLAAGRPAGLGKLTAASALALGALVALLRPWMLARGLPLPFVNEQAILLLVPLAVAALFLWVRPLRPAAVAAVVALLLLERTAEMGHFYPVVPVRAFYPPIRPLDHPFPPDRPARIVAQHFGLVPNQATHYRLEDARGYQALHHLRFFQLLPLWSQPEWFTRVERLDRPFLSFLNVRHALVPRGLQPAGWKFTARGGSLWLWRNPNALERAFLPRRVRIGDPEQERLAGMQAASDFAEVAWIEPPGQAGASMTPREEENGRGKLAVTRRGLRLLLTADLESRAWVVISNTAWRGWRAREGRRELPLGIANHAFLGLELPAGHHEVELFFRPRSFELGLGISAATLGVLVLGAVVVRRRRRGEAEGPPGGAAARRLGDRVEIPGDYQYRALHYGPAPQRFWHWAKLSEAKAGLALAPGMRVLDAGCGSGLLAAMVAEEPGVEVVGVDANERAITFARETFQRDNLSFRLGLVDDLALAPGSFDRIVFLEVIEHLTRAQGEATLAGFHRLLAPGGRLVLSTPNRHSLWPLLEWSLDRFGPVPNLGEGQHEHLYTRAELEALARSAGLTLLETRMVDTFAPWLAILSRRLAEAVHRWEVRNLRRGGSLLVMSFEKGR